MFSAKDFLDLGKRGIVDVTLSNLLRSGEIEKIAWGLYAYPLREVLGVKIPISVDEVVRALARKRGWQIIVHGARAANSLGLSSQVPSKDVYLSSGPTCTMDLDGYPVRFMHVCSRTIGPRDSTSSLVFQALRFLGRKNVNSEIVENIRTSLSEKARRRLLKDSFQCEAWICDVSQQIAA